MSKLTRRAYRVARLMNKVEKTLALFTNPKRFIRYRMNLLLGKYVARKTYFSK